MRSAQGSEPGPYAVGVGLGLVSLGLGVGLVSVGLGLVVGVGLEPEGEWVGWWVGGSPPRVGGGDSHGGDPDADGGGGDTEPVRPPLRPDVARIEADGRGSVGRCVVVVGRGVGTAVGKAVVGAREGGSGETVRAPTRPAPDRWMFHKAAPTSTLAPTIHAAM